MFHVLENKAGPFWQKEMRGPCCCKSYVQAALVLGIVFLFLNILGCILEFKNFLSGQNFEKFIFGFVGALFSFSLIYGAFKREATAILAWTISEVVYCILYVILAIPQVRTMITGCQMIYFR